MNDAKQPRTVEELNCGLEIRLPKTGGCDLFQYGKLVRHYPDYFAAYDAAEDKSR